MEADALENLLVAASVNKRLLMRILAHLEKRDLRELHEEVAALDREFRGTVHEGMLATDTDPQAPRDPTEERVPQGELPTGREEERRGHALANPHGPSASSENVVIGKDRSSRGTAT